MIHETITTLKKLKPNKPVSLMAISYDKWIMLSHPSYYNSVIKVIEQLAKITEAKGHSEALDNLKNRAYHLIEL